MTPPETPMIRAKALTKRFGRTVALAGVDLLVERGECVGLAGANGGGRTTLLRILATLSIPSAGTVEIDGFDAVKSLYQVRTRLAYAGTELLAGHGLRVREYLAFVRAARGKDTGQDAVPSAVDRVLERAQLPPDAGVDELSTGMRQRLALAAAFLIDPEVLLLDDPLRSLDPAARSGFLAWLREIRDRGTTIVVALNDEGEMKALCHGTVLLNQGRLDQGRLLPRSGSCESIHNRSSTPAVGAAPLVAVSTGGA